MTYVSKTFSYLVKSLRLLVPIALLPALLLGMFSKPMSFITFIPSYGATDVKSFGDIAWLIFDKYSFTHIYPVILIFVALTLSCALSLSVIEKHFRIGKLMLKAPVQDVNSSLFPTLKTLAVMAGIYLAWKFVLTGIATLLHFIISGQGVPSHINIAVLAVIIAALFLFSLCLCLPSILWSPLMLTFGYSFVDAFIEAPKLTGKAVFKLLTALIFPFAIVILLQCVVEFLPLHIAAVKAIATVEYLFLIVYIVSFMMVAAFDLTGLDRRDIKKSYV